MKTTSFEISKRLAEIGFKTEYDYAYFDTRKSWKEYNCPPKKCEYADSEFVPFYRIEEGHPDLELVNIKEHGPEYNPSYGYNDSKPIPSYDLETILEALPIGTAWVMAHGKPEGFDKIETIISINPRTFAERNDDESLVDTAARLLILLHEKGSAIKELESDVELVKDFGDGETI